MKNKIFIVGAIGFMTIITAPVFSQTTTPVNQAVPKKIIQPANTLSGNKGGVNPSTTVQSVHSTPTTNTQVVPKKIIQPTTLTVKNRDINPATHSTNAALTAPMPKHPMRVPTPAQPVSTEKSTATNISTPAVH